jgi:hypothetical protein
MYTNRSKEQMLVSDRLPNTVCHIHNETNSALAILVVLFSGTINTQGIGKFFRDVLWGFNEWHS